MCIRSYLQKPERSACLCLCVRCGISKKASTSSHVLQPSALTSRMPAALLMLLLSPRKSAFSGTTEATAEVAEAAAAGFDQRPEDNRIQALSPHHLASLQRKHHQQHTTRKNRDNNMQCQRRHRHDCDDLDEEQQQQYYYHGLGGRARPRPHSAHAFSRGGIADASLQLSSCSRGYYYDNSDDGEEYEFGGLARKPVKSLSFPYLCEPWWQNQDDCSDDDEGPLARPLPTSEAVEAAAGCTCSVVDRLPNKGEAVDQRDWPHLTERRSTAAASNKSKKFANGRGEGGGGGGIDTWANFLSARETSLVDYVHHARNEVVRL